MTAIRPFLFALVFCVMPAIGSYAVDDQDVIVVPSALITIIESVDVAASSSGILTSANMQEGKMVKMGEQLVRIDDTAARLKANQAALSLAEAKQKYANDVAFRLAEKTHYVAKAEYHRAERINQGIPNSVAASEMAVLKLTVDQTALEIEQARHNQSLLRLGIEQREVDAQFAEHELSLFSVRSPIEGMVLHVEKNVGEWVQPGDLLVRVVRIDTVRAEGFMKAAVAGQHLVGRRATLEVEKNGRAISANGSVVFVSPVADPVNGDCRIWSEFDNPKLTLNPGLRGNLRIEPFTAADVTTVPVLKSGGRNQADLIPQSRRFGSKHGSSGN